MGQKTGLPIEIGKMDAEIKKYENKLRQVKLKRELTACKTGYCEEFYALFYDWNIREMFSIEESASRHTASAELRKRLGNMCLLLHALSKELHLELGGADEWGERDKHSGDDVTAYDVLMTLFEDVPLEALKEIVAYREKEK